MKNPSLASLRFFRTLGVVTGLVIGAGLVAARADSVVDSNVFSNKQVAVSSNSGYTGSDPKVLVDGASAAFFTFADRIAQGSVSISGFNAAIDTLRFFGGAAPRVADRVTIYYSAKVTNSLDPKDYESKVNEAHPFTLDIEDGLYTNSAIRPEGPDIGPEPEKAPVFYARLTDLHIPAGTQSILFVFTNSAQVGGNEPTSYGPSFLEIQGFSPAAKTPEPSPKK